jgi:hypothetical protein
MNKNLLLLTRSLLFFLFISLQVSYAQQSVARKWNEALLFAIENDLARPTVHARNLFHVSMAMYDAWAAYDTTANTALLGNTYGNLIFDFDGVDIPEDVKAAQEEAISYAAYRLLTYRFVFSPGGELSLAYFDSLFTELGYDPFLSSTNYKTGSPAALGNYISAQLIRFGQRDGSNERHDFANQYYETVNQPLRVTSPGNPNINDPNRWQPLTLDVFIDQSGNVIPFNTPDFLGPEWGKVIPFALSEDDLNIYERDSGEYWVYHDPGPPPYLEPETGGGLSAEYQWGFSLVAVWSSQLDPSDSVLIDISPASLGNIDIQQYPTTLEGLRSFYNLERGGDLSQGHDLNPHTGLPYEPNIVPKGDYARILAEFWADGPNSETPPGHWFSIMNYVHDHPDFERKYRGQGPEIDDLEWDVKAYLLMGGAMHDVAITAWGIKGWYDYIRPISAIRAMADYGQSSDPELPNYHPAGMPLIPGYIELVQEGDSLAGAANEHLNKVKLYAWRGPDFIEEPETDEAGVGWILAENWWPYQRPSFVTPNFAGYISGHSTYSRAAAEILTKLTGDPYFPGGMGTFDAKKNEFLVFEEGPSQDIVLQWATYRDASDQTSLSRIWGGIHPPADDIPGRLIGIEIAEDAFKKAEGFFYTDQDKDGYLSYEDCDDLDSLVYPMALEIADGKDNDCDGIIDNLTTNTDDVFQAVVKAYPNPVKDELLIEHSFDGQGIIQLFHMNGHLVKQVRQDLSGNSFRMSFTEIPKGAYTLIINDGQGRRLWVGKILH